MHDPIRRKSRTSIVLVFAGAAIAAALAPAARAAEPGPELPQVIRVTETFNGSPFECRVESRRQESGYAVYRLTYPSPVVTPVPQNNRVPAEYYLPDGVRPDQPKRPAVVCMHILDGDFVLVRMTCSMLASHGIPAIMFKLPYYDERGLADGPRALAADPKLFVSALSQGLEDVRRAVDVLASRPEVDPQRIGIAGISLGAIVSASSAGVEPRLNRVMLILGGGDLRAVIDHAYETRELLGTILALPPDERSKVQEAIDAVDPLHRANCLRERARQGKVLMVNAAEDEVIPRSCTEKLASALGIGDRVIWLDGLGHYTAMAELPQILEMAVSFFAQDLPPGLAVVPPAAPSRTPNEIAASLLQQATTVLASEPAPDRCHFVDFSVSAAPAGEDPFEARLRFIRGRKGKFMLECDLPVLGQAALGQGEYPWMVSGRKMLFKGTGGPAGASSNPLAFAEPQHVMSLRMAAGAAAGIMIAPHVLSQWAKVTDDTPAQGPPAIRAVLKENDAGTVRLALKEDGKTPQQMTFDVGGVQGTITVRGWQTNTVAHPSMFEPPAGLPEREVDRADLYRIFSAMFNFAMESAL